MSTTYAGDSTNNPDSITIPSDGQGPIKAADVNPAFEGCMDKAAYGVAREASLRTRIIRSYVRNFTAVDIGFTQDDFIAATSYDDANGVGRFYAMLSDSTNAYQLWGSLDGGKAWTMDSGGALTGGATNFYSIAVNPNTGTVCMGKIGTSGSAGGIARVTGFPSGTQSAPHVDPSITSDDVYTKGIAWFVGAAKFVAVGNSTPDTVNFTPFASHSADDGVTWTGHTIAAAIGAPLANISYSLVQSASRLAAFGLTSKTAQGGAGDYSYATTDNATSWTTRTIPLAGGGGESIAAAGYDAGRGLFVVVTSASKAYTSPDAITWTAVATATPVAFTSFTVFDEMWVGGNGAYLYTSNDGGATWKRSPAALNFAVQVLASGHEIAIFAADAIYVSPSLG